MTPAEHYAMAEKLLAGHSGPEGDALWGGTPPADVILAQVHATLATVDPDVLWPKQWVIPPAVLGRHQCPHCEEAVVYSIERDLAEHIAALHPGAGF